MGFPSVCYCIILPKPLILVLQLLDLFKLAASIALCYLGLFQDTPYPPPYSPGSVALSPSSSAPVHPSVIKRTLPVVKFSTLRKKTLPSLGGDEAICAVCLGKLEEEDEVRDLGSCSHVFHRLCLDKWVDVSQVTCPLCRAWLLPKGREEICLWQLSGCEGLF